MSDSVRPWRPPEIARPVDAGKTGGSVGAAPLGRGASAGGGADGGADGPRGRRWHEAHDEAGLTALLGGRRPVRVPDGGVDPDAPDASGPGADDPDPDGAGRRADEAFDAGFAAGEKAAGDALAGALGSLADAFARETSLAAEALEEELVALARTLAACAMRRELRIDRDDFVAFVREALGPLDSLATEAPITVRLHPDDAEAVGERLGPDVRVTVDPSLGRADCRVERGASRIDAGVRARIEAVCAEFEGGGGEASADDGADEPDRAGAEADPRAEADVEAGAGADTDAEVDPDTATDTGTGTGADAGAQDGADPGDDDASVRAEESPS